MLNRVESKLHDMTRLLLDRVESFCVLAKAILMFIMLNDPNGQAFCSNYLHILHVILWQMKDFCFIQIINRFSSNKWSRLQILTNHDLHTYINYNLRKMSSVDDPNFYSDNLHIDGLDFFLICKNIFILNKKIANLVWVKSLSCLVDSTPQPAK